MKVTLVVNNMAAHQVELCGLMACGMKACGVEVECVRPGTLGTGDLVVCWGWHIGREYSDRDVLVLERGHVGNRRAYTSAGWNGLGGYGTYPPCLDDGARWRARHGDLMKPWRPLMQPGHQGHYALLIGQCYGDAAVADLPSFAAWARASARALAAQGWPVRYRPHPLMRGVDLGPGDVPVSTATLAEDLAGAALCVTYSSTTGIESVLAGVPTIAMGRGSMARAVAGHSLDDVVQLPRKAWADRLAWAQWDRDELASGAAWTTLLAVKP